MGHLIFNRFFLAGAMLAALAATPAIAADPRYTPSAANQCGRLEPVHLALIPSSRYLAPYPEDARQRGQKGHVLLRVLVDKYGFARHPEVVISSGYDQLDQAAIDGIKDRWRWELPPPECRESGVLMSVSYNWGLYWAIGEKKGDVPSPVYLDNPLYPAEVREHEQGGNGEVEYTISPDNRVTDAHVISGTGSPALDAAMIALIHDWTFPTIGTASTAYTGKQRFEFLPRNNPDTPKALTGPAITPNPAYLPGKAPRLAFLEPYPPPGLANGCGRDAPAYLEPSLTDMNPHYPVEAAATGKQGRTVLDILVDKGGTASEVTVIEASGSPIFDRAAVEGVKGLWHFLPPPPECADQGAHLRKNIDWSRGIAPTVRVMAGDPGYPAEALAGKLSGRGMAQINLSQNGKVEFTRVLVSTKSEILDAAMIKVIIGAHFTPGTKEGHTALLSFADIEFVGDPAALRAQATAPVRRVTPLPPAPSLANDCGRGGDVYLAAVDASHVLVPIPMVEVGRSHQIPDYGHRTVVEIPAKAFRAQGALKMQVLVDKVGKAASVTVAASSAPPEMERAVTGTVKENYRWAPPPPECADRGVMLNVNYVYTDAPEKLQIYADDPAYPEAARANSMGAAGIAEIRFHGDKIDDAKVVISAGSADLDAAMIRVISDRLLADMRANPMPGSDSRNFPVMFMPGFVSSPKQTAAARATQAQAAAP